MGKTKSDKRNYSRNYDLMEAESSSKVGRGSGGDRRFLKQLDRQLSRFSRKVDALEKAVGRTVTDEGGDTLVEVEMLQREVLLLRAEIREYLARGDRSATGMVEHAEESWDQMCETYEELKSSLNLGREVDEVLAEAAAEKRHEPDSDDDEWIGDWEDEEGAGDGDEDADEDDWDEDDYSYLDAEVHPPRIGPKR